MLTVSVEKRLGRPDQIEIRVWEPDAIPNIPENQALTFPTACGDTRLGTLPSEIQRFLRGPIKVGNLARLWTEGGISVVLEFSYVDHLEADPWYGYIRGALVANVRGDFVLLPPRV